MSSGGNLLELGLSGLRVSQQGLATTSHNIANATTPGYSRQRVETAAGPPTFAAGSYFGSGARTIDVRRSYDQFLTQELQSDTSAAADLRTQHGLAADLDALLSRSETGLAPMLQGFFDALAAAAADPASGTTRQVLLDAADRLAERFGSLDGRLQQTHAAVHAEARIAIDEINQLASKISDLNLAIAQTRGKGAAPNDLLDQRDELVRQLSERVSVTTLPQDDGSLSVFVGSGQPLVVGTQAFRLAAGPSAEDPTLLGVTLAGSGGTRVDVTAQIHGGTLGGLVAFERGLLADAERTLGQIALGLAERLNAQHRLGVDLNGQPGGDLFTSVNDPALTAARAQGRDGNLGSAELSVTVDSVALLQASDYRLTYNGTEYRLVRQRDNQLVGTFADLPQTIASEGFSIELTAGAMAAGDSFILRPAAGAAGQMRTLPPDGESLALASVGGPGDNGNALALAEQQAVPVLFQGTASLAQGYERAVADVASRTRGLELAADAQELLVQRSVAERESMAGVNLDEEAAELLRYQQAYEASARVISVSNELFQTVLRALGG